MFVGSVAFSEVGHVNMSRELSEGRSASGDFAYRETETDFVWHEMKDLTRRRDVSTDHMATDKSIG